ncbi:MAG: S41 family peptidase [Muribaculaceae bacterium]|nr:S41 family peptidase [Muribaculaceae bacterium]
MRKNAILSLLPVALMLTGILAGRAFRTDSPEQKLLMAEKAIAQLYVDSVDENKMVEDAIRGMLEKLDPHSAYSTPEETRELNEPLQGNFSGIGITFNMSSDTLYVIQTVSGGPSERVGILAGDRIIAVNDTAIAGVKMKNSDVMKRLRGPKGTDVDVTVLRIAGPAEVDTIDFTITRADIPIYSVDAAYLVDASTGYIRINRFAAETAKEVRDAIRRLKKEGMKQLILDLTDNGGGYLQASTQLLGELLPEGSLAVYTEGLNSPRYDATAQPEGKTPLFADGRLVVMVNQYSASASEITSGAVQDHDRGVVVGRRSFGKGLVQRPLPLPDGSMIRLTVAHYYTPTGRDIQKPYSKGDEDAYRRDIEERFNHGELMHEDSIRRNDSTVYRTLRLKRPVYGGGGITPDAFVPLDTMEYTKYYRNVMAKGLINRYAIGYVDANRKEIRRRFKTDDAFVKGFEVTPDMLEALRAMADKEGVEFDREQFERSAPLFGMVIKGLIGRDIYDNATYFKVFNSHDPIFRRAYEIINSQDYTTLLSPPLPSNEE